MPDTASTLRLRPWSLLSVAALFLAMSFGCVWVAGTATYLWGRLDWMLMAVYCGVIAVGLAWWYAESELLLDEEGLRWREGREWVSLSWSAVTDYFEASLPQGKSADTMLVVVGEGCFYRMYSRWPGAAAFRDRVNKHAASARSRSWVRRDHRELDERTVRFLDDPHGMHLLLWIGYLTLFVYVPGVTAWVMSRLPGEAAVVGWSHACVSLGAKWLIYASLGGFAVYAIRLARASLRPSEPRELGS